MSFIYNLTYANVPLLLDVAKVVKMPLRPDDGSDGGPSVKAPSKNEPLDDLIDELNRRLDFEYLQDFTLPSHYPGRNLGAIAYQWQVGPQPSADVKINDFYYPNTASRWSVFRGLATSSEVKAMLAATAGNTPGLFVMQAAPVSPNNPSGSASAYTVSTNMYMLPPRPLGEHAGGMDGLYLITLVDERYWWQYNAVSLGFDTAATWAANINLIAQSLGVTINFAAVPAVYSVPEPDSQFWTNYENAALLLDAVAYNIGTTVVRGLDGTYTLMPPLTSQSLINASRGVASKVVRTAGGDIFYAGDASLPVGDLSAARNLVLPASVNVTFPMYVYGDDPVPHFLNPRYLPPQRPSAWYEESFGNSYAVNLPVASGGITPIASGSTSGGSITSQTPLWPLGLTGVSGYVHTIHTTAKALYGTETAAVGNPDNVSGLTALATQIAADFYNGQISSALDEAYPGTYAWTPEGIHDIIWRFSAKASFATTRVMRSEWNQIVREMQHSAPPLANQTNIPRGVGGKAVAQTIRDAYGKGTTPVTTQLAAGLNSGDMVVAFQSVGYLPTQNRWRGQIRSEVILFEGTSGGQTLTFSGGQQMLGVSVVSRAIDGTLQPPQISGIDGHPNGATITQLTPDVSYGVNLITSEKMAPIYPGVWTSGGIQEARIVPQTQTVNNLCISGLINGGITYYSGQVNARDAVTGNLTPQELCWVVDRNGNPLSEVGAYYDGQFGYYSPTLAGPGSVAPVYLVNENPVSGTNQLIPIFTSGGQSIIRASGGQTIIRTSGQVPNTININTINVNYLNVFNLITYNYITINITNNINNLNIYAPVTLINVTNNINIGGFTLINITTGGGGGGPTYFEIINIGTGNATVGPPAGGLGPPSPFISAILNGAGVLPAGSVVSYVVTSVGPGGESAPSAPASASITSNNSAVIITWAPVPGATGYNVYGRGNNGLFGLLGTGQPATIPPNWSFTDGGNANPGGPPPAAGIAPPAGAGAPGQIINIPPGGAAGFKILPGAGGAVLVGGNLPINSGSITPSQIASGYGLTGSGAITSGMIGSGAITSGKLASGSVCGGYLICSGGIQWWHAASGYSLIGSGLASGMITPTMIASGYGLLGSGAVKSGMIASGTCLGAFICSGEITWSQIASGFTVIGSGLASGAIASGMIAPGAITSGTIGSGGVCGNFLICSGGIQWWHLASGYTVIGSGLASGAITSGMIGSGAIVSGAIASGVIGPIYIASGYSLVGSGALTSGVYGSGAITSGVIASGTTAINMLTLYSGTTSDPFTDVFNIINSGGLHGSFVLKNIDGANTLTYQIIGTDVFGTTATGTSVTVAPGGLFNFAGFDNQNITVSLKPPYNKVQLQAKSTAGGSPAKYNCYTSIVG